MALASGLDFVSRLRPIPGGKRRESPPVWQRATLQGRAEQSRGRGDKNRAAGHCSSERPVLLGDSRQGPWGVSSSTTRPRRDLWEPRRPRTERSSSTHGHESRGAFPRRVAFEQKTQCRPARVRSRDLPGYRATGCHAPKATATTATATTTTTTATATTIPGLPAPVCNKTTS